MTWLSLLLGNSTLLLIGAIIVAWFGGNMRGRLAGAAKERAKQAASEAKARDIADDVENDIGAIPPDTARERLKKW
jgi:hypothetical protein